MTQYGDSRSGGVVPRSGAAVEPPVVTGGIRNTPVEMENTEIKGRVGRGVSWYESEGVKLLCAGVDTVHVGLAVDWPSISWPGFRDCLEDGRKNARLADGGKAAGGISGLRVVHHGGSGKGRMNYRYHFESSGCHVWVSDGPDARKFGNVLVKFGAEWLWSNMSDWGGAITRFLDDLVLRGNGVESWRQLSRVDLACDYLMPGGLDYRGLLAGAFPEKMKKAYVGSPADGETVYIGNRKGELSVVVYDKGKELRRSLKLWCLDLWGIDRSRVSDVVRVECRFTRAFWRKGLDDPSVVLGSSGCISALWELALDRVQWRIADGRQVNHRVVHPFWLRLRADMAGVYGAACDVRWVKKPSGHWDDVTYLDKRVLPALAGWCERRGLGDDLAAGLRDVLSLVESDPLASECALYRGLVAPSAPF